METFTPSLDWGNEIVDSVLWVAKAWAISAVCILVVLALIARFTTWGRQFWRVTGDYFKGRESVLVWAWLGVLLLSVMVSVRIDVLCSYYGNDQYLGAADRVRRGRRGQRRGQRLWDTTAFGSRSCRSPCWPPSTSPACCWTSISCSASSCAGGCGSPIDSPATGWTDAPTTADGSSTSTIDNPDQRIQQDIDVFTTGTGPETNTPTDRDVPHAAVRRRQFDRVGGVVHPDPVESVRPVDDSRLHAPQGAVLDGVALRVLRDGRRVLDRPPADPTELPQRGDQRGIPLRPGPAARRRRGGRVLPRRARRAQDAGDALRRDHRTTTGRSSDAASPSSAGTSR